MKKNEIPVSIFVEQRPCVGYRGLSRMPGRRHNALLGKMLVIYLQIGTICDVLQSVQGPRRGRMGAKMTLTSIAF